jgi:hypothetical protein
MSTFDDRLVESALVKAEFKRMRELLGIQEKALALAIKDAEGEITHAALERKIERYLGRAVAVLA